MVSQSHPGTSRRTLLTGAIAATAVAGLGGLSGCTSSKGGGSGSTPSKIDKGLIPAYQPYATLPKPDLAGTEKVPNYYFSYPKDRPKTVNHALGGGGDLTAMILTYAAPPKPLDQNPYWKKINETIGKNLKLDMVSSDNYQSKFSTVTASGDLPMLTQVVNYMQPPRLDALVKGQFEDLTEYLKGENVKKWPNIAALPASAWATATLNGVIWGVPVIPQPFQSGLWMRADLAEKKGIKEEPKSKDDFLAWCEEMTDAKGGKYALGGFAGGSPVWIPNTGWGMFKVPNRFRLDGDKLTKAQETDEYLEAIEFTKQLWDKKYFHPDSPQMPTEKNTTAFWNGTIAAKEGGFGAYWEQGGHKDAKMRFRTPWAADGGPGVHWEGTAFSVTAIKKGTKNVEEILNILDWFHAPFGSEEHFISNFGVEGVTYEMKNGEPMFTKEADSYRALNTIFIGAGKEAIYTTDPELKPHYEAWYQTQKQIEPMLLPDPTAGYYAAANTKAGALDKAIDDAQGDYIMGRKSLDEFKQVIKDWRKNGGDEIVKQYEAAIQANK